MAKLTLILGGARSGKSRYALDLAGKLAGDDPVTYLATGQAGDDEMRDRIARHRADRPAHWHTLEEPLGVAESIRRLARQSSSPPVILIDCLTFFVVNHMLQAGDPTTCETELWDVEGTERAVSQLLTAILDIEGEVILVSNEVGMGLVPETPLGRAFRDCAGRANQCAAAAADRVFLMVAGLPMTVKIP